MTSAVDGGEWSALRPGRSLPQGKDPEVPIKLEAGLGLRAGLDTEGSNCGRPVCSQALYWLSYPSP
jgi:hypothetical protein